MSVNTSDEYLDELLQSIEPIIYPNGREEDVPMASTQEEDNSDVLQTDEAEQQKVETATVTEAASIEEVSVEETTTEEENVEILPMSEDGYIQELIAEAENAATDMQNESALVDLENAEQEKDSEEVSFDTDSSGQDAESDSTDISDLLAALTADSDDIEEIETSSDDIESMLNAVMNQPVEEAAIDDNQDVKDLLKQFSDDEDLSDIQDMLDRSDNGEALDESLLDIPDVEVFQLEEGDTSEDEDASEKKAGIVGKVLGGFANLFRKRKKKADEQEADSVEKTADSEESSDIETDMISLDLLASNDVEETEEIALDDDMADIEMLLSGGNLDGISADTDVELLNPDALENVPEKKKSGKGKKKNKEKKESFFSRMLNILTEEIEEPEETKKSKGGKVPEAGATGITDENRTILEELSKEDKKKAKKAAKEEKKNKKKGKNASKDGDEEAEGNGKKGKPKKEKKKKEKKIKTVKVKEISKPEKKLPRKRVLSIFGLCFSILAAVLILHKVVSETQNSKEAEYAYQTADYETCFANLNGMERNEEEEALYQKSLIILSVQRKMDAYDNFMKIGYQEEAINSLLEGVVIYREKTADAEQWNVQSQFASVYQSIMKALLGWGLSEADIEEILGYESKVTYTKRLESIVNGTPFSIEDTFEYQADVIKDSAEGNYEEMEVPSESDQLEDVLPQEEDFLNKNLY